MCQGGRGSIFKILFNINLTNGDGFIDNVNEHSEPTENRFRFTNKSVEGGCRQWNGKGCGLANFVVQYLNKVSYSENLHACAIRTSCRWFLQHGSSACKICPYVGLE